MSALILKDISHLVSQVPESVSGVPIAVRIEKVFEKMDKYSGHLIRSKLQKKIFDSFLSRLDGKKALVVLDFKMKFLYRVFRESQSAFFGQRGNSNLGIVFIFKPDPNSEDIHIEYLDFFCNEDTTQDWFFVSSALQIANRQFKERHPSMEEEFLITDNGGCFHSSGFILWCQYSYSLTKIKILEYAFFEAGEGKSVCDQHFKRWDDKIAKQIASGKNVSNPKEVSEALKGLSGHCIQIF